MEGPESDKKGCILPLISCYIHKKPNFTFQALYGILHTRDVFSALVWAVSEKIPTHFIVPFLSLS